MNERRTCGTCAFFAMNPKDMDKGDCRFAPPLQYVFPMDKEVKFLSRWPNTERNSKSCSQHRTDAEREFDRSRLEHHASN